MKKELRRTIVLALGGLFIIIGIIGLVLPFLQGILFIIIGLLLISAYSPKLRAWMDRHTVKYPKLHNLVKKAEAWIVRTFGEL